MRKCPKCKSVFTDDDLAFCLSDGTALGEIYGSNETLQLPDFHAGKTIPIVPAMTADISEPSNAAQAPPAANNIPPTLVSERKEAHPTRHNLWAYSTIGLIALAIGGAGTLFLTGALRPDASANAVNRLEHGPTSAEGGSASVGSKTTPADQKGHTDPPPEPTPAVATPLPVVGPGPGTFHVVNVAAGDVLYVRAAPGNIKSSSGTIPPNATGVNVTGAAVRSGKSAWSPVSYNGVSGWVNSRFLAKD
ncbi:MAG: SH3 domain-containing protein [Pyrinomonadaceae bacterium]